MRKLRFALIVVIAAVLLLFTTSGHFLIVNDPQPADVIIVLAGETDRRPARGIELLSKNYAPRLLLDVPAASKIYDRNMLDIARAYVQALPQSQSVDICPIVGLSTKTEARDVHECLDQMAVHRILLVTSDYHTRRAKSTFQHVFPAYEVSVATANDPQQFGASWWTHRQWAKVNLDEWLRLVWWQAVDRWR
jgi:uncharacterized SAM-binding protein YcdF (DUF218 family)